MHQKIDIDLQDDLRSSRALWAHNLWELSCAGFRHSAGFHARVILDGAACRLGELGDVHDELGVLGYDRVVPVVLRVLVSCLKEDRMKKMMCFLSTAGERTTNG